MGFLGKLLKLLTGTPSSAPTKKPSSQVSGSIQVPQTRQRPSIPLPKRKSDWQLIRQIVDANEVTTLHHFTDRANLESIKRNGGLYSWSYCERNGVRISRPGGNQLSRSLDNRRDIGDYVRLSFVNNTPMLYIARRDGRILSPVILEIDPDVIYWETTLFSDGNATANRSCIGGNLADFQRICFDILIGRPRC